MGVLGCLNWFCEENPFRGVGCSYRQVISYFILNVVYPFTVFFFAFWVNAAKLEKSCIDSECVCVCV